MLIRTYEDSEVHAPTRTLLEYTILTKILGTPSRHEYSLCLQVYKWPEVDA
jgi:hypothetical protein